MQPFLAPWRSLPREGQHGSNLIVKKRGCFRDESGFVGNKLVSALGESLQSLVASAGAGICEGFACLRDEFPLVSAGRERQPQDAERLQRVHFAIRANDSERTQILVAGSHNEFPDAAAGIGSAVRILWGEAFVIVIMAVDDYVGVGFVESVPQRFHQQLVAWAAAGTEKRLVEIA